MLTLRNTTLILQQLRLVMQFYFESGTSLDALIVPTADAHHNIRIADCDQRRAFISGFDGSAGTAIVTQQEALLWTDGRYFILASEQLDENWTLMKEGIDVSQAEWLVQNVGVNGTVGVDPEQFSKVEWEAMSLALRQGGQRLMAVNNLIDKIWVDRPQRPNNPIVQLPIQYAGQSVEEKIKKVRQQAFHEGGTEVLVISEMDEIPWLLNLRGSDLPLAPVFFAYVILTGTKVEIFLHVDSISPQIIADLQAEIQNVTFHPYENVYERLSSIVQEEPENVEAKFWLSNNANYALARLIPEDRLLIKLSPVAVMKAVKNPTEVDGMRSAFIRDSAVVSIFYAWLEQTMNNEEPLSEISAANQLYEFRMKADKFVSLSFKTISGSGPNAAIVHYWPTNDTDRKLSKDEMYLVDSGAHYLDGTTDGTRTFHFGSPSDHQKDCYTRVLKGQIAMATLTFPIGVTGHTIDAFARKSLWEVGLDYAHGTGHGIGAYLNVGEGPQSISYSHDPNDPGLRENMFASNEPGYYEEDNFGIRLENALRISNSTVLPNFLIMEDLIFVPYQQSLIKVDLLTDKEIEYLNGYFKKCREVTGQYILDNPNLAGDFIDVAMTWLLRETQEIQRKNSS